MSWPASLLLAVLSGALGMVCGGFIMNACVAWYRISRFEGKAGFAIVGVALLGGIAGFLIGLIAARMVAAGGNPGVLKGLLYGCGAVLTISLFSLLVCRLGADLEPTLDGHSLELAIEIRCPESFSPQEKPHVVKATAEVYLPKGRRLPSGELSIDQARKEESRWIIPGNLPLTTSSSNKILSVALGDENLLFSLPLRANPNRLDLEWSQWVDSGWAVGTQRPQPGERFSMRYRIRLVEPSPPAFQKQAPPEVPESSAP